MTRNVSTRLREQIYSPISAADAHAVVREFLDFIDDAANDPADDVDGDDAYSELDVFDDVDLGVDASLPADPSGDAKALARFPACRSTFTLDYDGRVADKRPFIALQKLVIARAGDAVVWSGEGGERPPAKGAKIITLEAFVADREKNVGPRWRTITPLGEEEEPVRKPVKTRAAKPGELEALAVHKRLSSIIEGRDPLAREALRKRLEGATAEVRAYAAALMENGATPDAAIAQDLDRTAREVAESREALHALLSKIR